MERSRWAALAVVVLYVAVDILLVAPHFRADGQADQGSFPGQRAGSFLAFVGFACVWWPDVLGAVILRVRHGGPIPERWTIVVRILGWALLVLAVKLRFDLIPQLKGLCLGRQRHRGGKNLRRRRKTPPTCASMAETRDFRL